MSWCNRHATRTCGNNLEIQDHQDHHYYPALIAATAADNVGDGHDQKQANQTVETLYQQATSPCKHWANTPRHYTAGHARTKRAHPASERVPTVGVVEGASPALKTQLAQKQ